MKRNGRASINAIQRGVSANVASNQRDETARFSRKIDRLSRFYAFVAS